MAHAHRILTLTLALGLSMNVGVSAQQLRQVVRVLADTVSADTSQRAQVALQVHLPQEGRH